MSALLCTALLFAAPAQATAPRPSVVVTPFAGDPAEAWLSFVVADHLTSRLLVHSRMNPQNLQRIYPLNVFGWRQAAAAARAEGLEGHALDAAALEKLRRQLGADWALAGRYERRSGAVKLSVRLVGPKTIERQVSAKPDELSQACESIALEVISALGQTGEALESHRLLPLPESAARPYGEALALLARQSLDPRAKLVLDRPTLERAHALLGVTTTTAPDFVRGWVESGVVSAMLGDSKRAEAELVRSMAGDLEPATALGLYYFYDRQGKTEDAVKVLVDATDAHLGFLQGLGYLGQAYVRLIRNHEALQVFTSYAQRVPASPWARVQRAAALSHGGQHDTALAEMEALAKQVPGSVMVQTALALRCIDAGKLERARTLLEALLAAHPGHPVVLTRLAYVALSLGRTQEGLKLAEQAAAAVGDGRGEPLAGYAHLNLGYALVLAGRLDDAYAALARAKELGVDEDELRYVTRDPKLFEALQDTRSPFRPAGARVVR